MSLFGVSDDRKYAIIEAQELLQFWSDVTMMYQGEFDPLYKTYYAFRKEHGRLPKSHQLLSFLVQNNFPKYFPDIPVLELRLERYEVHEYEGP